MKIRFRNNLFTAAALGLFAALVVCSAASADDAAISAALTKYVETFNQHDAAAVAACWTEKCVHNDLATGETTTGREAMQSDLAEVFKAVPDSQLTGTIDTVRMIRPDVASVVGTTLISGGRMAPAQSVFSAIMVLSDGKWQLDSVDESPIAGSASALQMLGDLQWLVGAWQDESDGITVETSCKWSPNDAFLIRSFVMARDGEVASQGTQVIGWDARQNHIRSWTFDSDGSFGEGIWSRNGKDWLVKSSQTLADGGSASGTYVISREGDDAMMVQLIGHEENGVPMPSNPPVRVVRVADAEVSSEETPSEAGVK